MQQRVAFFWTTYSAYGPVRRVERELMLREKAAGSLIVGAYCDGFQERCHGMKRHRRDYLECVACQARHQDDVAPYVDRMLHLVPAGLGPGAETPIRPSQASLRAMNIDGSDIGTAVLSTIKTNHGDDDPPLDKLAGEVAAQLRVGAQVHARLAAALDEVRPDVVYMFNGRHFDSRPLLRLCQTRGIDFRTYETAVTRDRFAIAENATIHDNRATKARFTAYLTAAPAAVPGSARAAQIAAGQDVYGEGYRSRQKRARLPAGWSIERRNVVILHSSEDENSDVDHAPRLWSGQDFYSYLQQLATALEGEKSLRVYVRLHPRLARYNARSVARLLSFTHPIVEVLAPDSPVDTFAVACAADLCICYGSTAGPEAVLLGARVVNIADCAYSDSSMMPEARDLETLVRFIKHPEELACDPHIAAAYLDFLQSDGERFRFAAQEIDANRIGVDSNVIEMLRRFFLRHRIPYARLRIDYLIYKAARLRLLMRRVLDRRLRSRRRATHSPAGAPALLVPRKR